MLNIDQFRELIIKSTLNDLLLYSEDAEELLVFTCANESNGGTYLAQVKGPALGIFQMEPATYNDIWQNYIKKKQQLCAMLLNNFNISAYPSEERLIYDLRYATAMARIFYARFKEPLPSKNNVSAIWHYYKIYYNTVKGSANKESAIAAYESFIRC